MEKPAQDRATCRHHHTGGGVDGSSERDGRVERQQLKLFAATSYIRAQNHWLDELCRSGVLGAQWADDHPKPHLPDLLRDTIDPIEKENQ